MRAAIKLSKWYWLWTWDKLSWNWFAFCVSVTHDEKLCDRAVWQYYNLWQGNESSTGRLMKSAAVFTQDSLLSWLMCLLSPLIIIPIEVTPETAGTWRHISPCHTQWLVAMGKLVSQHTNTHIIVSWEIGKSFEKTFRNPKIDKLQQTYFFRRISLAS